VIPDGVMFNAYPDSCGGTLAATVAMLRRPEFAGAFRYFYILPSMFRSDLDRGFSVIAYDLEEELATEEDLAALRDLGLELKLDFVLNHLSAQSPQFLDLLERGDHSPWVHGFIDWNRFWEGHGAIGPEGYIVPEERYLSKLFMRKPGLPILSIPFPDGSTRHYWNTFYQSVSDDDPPRYLGQMDLNARSELVWEFYRETMSKLAAYGARVVRLDAFAYLHKEIGASNFFNEPGTWEYLARIRGIADDHGIVLLPEIHSTCGNHIHDAIAERGYPFYDFFFPGLVIDAIESGSAARLAAWIEEIRKRGFTTVNMLGCHDGIPVLDVKGILDEATIDGMIDLITRRGGRVKDLYGPDGTRISYYQVNATFFSALGEDPRSLILARAIQLFMPGIPQVWYLDIFAGTNDHEAADQGGHKEINRTNLSTEQIEERLSWPLVREQLALLRFRNGYSAFGPEAELTIDGGPDAAERLRLSWSRGDARATLDADLNSRDWRIFYRDGATERIFDAAEWIGPGSP
jgi:sucrose phosphorylase